MKKTKKKVLIKNQIVLETYEENGVEKIKEVLNACAKIKGVSIRYLVFTDLRNMGYLPKTAFKYGGDFRVYNKGATIGKEHAEWILYCSSEHESITMRSFSAMNRVAHSVRKKLLIGIADDEGSVTYYEINWVRM